MVRGVKVETKVAIITITQPEMMAHRRPNLFEIGAEKNTPLEQLAKPPVGSSLHYSKVDVEIIPETIPPKDYDAVISFLYS